MRLAQEKQIISKKNHNTQSTNISTKRVSSLREEKYPAIQPDIYFVFRGRYYRLMACRRITGRSERTRQLNGTYTSHFTTSNQTQINASSRHTENPIRHSSTINPPSMHTSQPDKNMIESIRLSIVQRFGAPSMHIYT